MLIRSYTGKRQPLSVCIKVVESGSCASGSLPYISKNTMGKSTSVKRVDTLPTQRKISKNTNESTVMIVNTFAKSVKRDFTIVPDLRDIETRNINFKYATH